MSKNTKRGFSITVLLATAVGGLITLAVASVLVLSAIANFRNTTELLEQLSNQTIDAIERQIKAHLEPARYVIEHVAAQARNGTIDVTDQRQMITTLRATLAAAPGLSGIAFWRPDGRVIRIRRSVGDKFVIKTDYTKNSARRVLFLSRFRSGDGAVWAEPARVDGLSFLSVVKPVKVKNQVLGYVAVGTSIDELSATIAASTTNTPLTGFILYGKTHVLAHKSLNRISKKNLTAKNPLHHASEIKDQVLAKFAQTKPEDLKADANNIIVRIIKSGQPTYLVISKPLKVYGKQQWHLGVYAKRRELTTQLRRMVVSIAAGLALLVLSVLAAIFLARRVAKPIKEISKAATLIGSLDLDKINALPGSRITELNNQSQAFNKMLVGLKWFEAYVPRKLVNKLIKENSEDATASRQVEVTVMFTDIVGFTRLSENLPPEKVAQLLNDHFELLNQCIEETGGTLDKYIGDSVMAFWGAPETQQDHALRACKTAVKIAERIDAEKGDLKIKVAIHSGPLIVGNIGAKGRMNYTVIGDTVNTASRIENLAGELNDGSKVFTLISDKVADSVKGKFETQPAGSFTVKGRKKQVKILRLLGNANV